MRMPIAAALAVLLGGGCGVAAAEPRTDEALQLEAAVQASPSAPEPWLAVAESYFKQGRQAQAALSYVRFLTLANDSTKSKVAASRLWDLLVPTGNNKPASISMRAPSGDSDPWWQIELLMSTARSMRHRGKAGTMSDEEYFAVALEGVTLFAVEYGNNAEAGALWKSVGIPYYFEARDKKFIESMAYEITSSLNRPATIRWIDQNAAGVQAFREWSRAWKPGA